MTYAAITLVTALAAATAAGWLLNRRSGVLRPVAEDVAAADLGDLGLSRTGPTIVHFSAVWCGPCAGVRQVVNRVCADNPGVAHVEIDMDADPATARRLSVLSLPTTFVFDAEGRQRYRSAGVPSVADLRSALSPLLA